MTNSTIIRKKKKCTGCNTLQYIFSKGMCQQCATVKGVQRRLAKVEEAEESESLQNMIDDADTLFSRLIRLKYADEKGFVRCYTSGVKMRWQDAQCGHFISRKHLGLRWEENNARPQSPHDNCTLHGNLDVFREKLNEEKPGIVEWLEEAARQVHKPTREEMRELIISLRYKVKLLEAKLKKP